MCFLSGSICFVDFIHIFIRCILILKSCFFLWVELWSLNNFTSICRPNATSLALFHIAFQLSQKATSSASKFFMFATSISKIVSLAWMTLLQKWIETNILCYTSDIIMQVKDLTQHIASWISFLVFEVIFSSSKSFKANSTPGRWATNSFILSTWFDHMVPDMLWNKEPIRFANIFPPLGDAIR